MDYRDFKTKSQREKEAKKGIKAAKNDPMVADGYWWKFDSLLERRLDAVIKRLRTQQMSRLIANTEHLRLYGDLEYQSLRHGGRMLPYGAIGPLDPSGKVTANVVRMSIDTLAAKISKNRPKPTFVTDGGNWALRQRARGLDRFIQGVFYANKVPRLAPNIFMDGCIFDIGVAKVYADFEAERICIERVLPTEIYVDELDSIYGAPRCLYQVKNFPRELVVEMYPDFEALIMTAGAPVDPMSGGPMATSLALADFVQVVEAWHLPSSEDSDDGKHVIATSNAVLNPDDMEWKRPRFPFAFYRWSERRQGFYGQGVSEQLRGDQRYVNKLLKTMAQSLHLTAVPRVWVEEGSGVDKSHITNEIGAIGFYRGTAPIFQAQSGVPPELFAEIERAKARAFERVGVSQLSVAAKKPAGLDSGQALRDYNDIESERFVLAGQAYEQFHLDLAEVIIDEAQELARVKKDFQVRTTDKLGARFYKWSEVSLERDEFVMKMFPSSSLPQTPAARRQQIAEWQASGWIDQTEARRLMDLPDLDNSNNLVFAGQEDIEAVCQDMLDGGKYTPPEPNQALQYGIAYMTSQHLRAKRAGAPQKVLKNLLAWVADAQDALDSAKAQMAAQAAPPAPPGAAPGGPPGPPPPQAQPGAMAA